MDDVFRAGVYAVEAGLYEQGEVRLDEVVQAAPAFYDPDRGSAAYWLGKVHQAAGRPDTAAAVWQRGWDQLARSGAVDLRLADVFIETVFEHQDSVRYEAAAAMYLTLLPFLEGDLSARLDSIRARHLVPLALILPEDLRKEVGLADAPTSGTAFLEEGSAERLLTWWRRMDPLPATPQNERVIEHLTRVGYARRHYGNRTTPTGLDDRGLIYIRLGPPSHRKEIRFDEVQYYGRMVPVPTFVKNEFWVYRHVHDAAQYLFVRPLKLQGYRLGLPEDLIPSTLRAASLSASADPSSSPSSSRAGRRADAMLEIMEQLYRDLALYHTTGHYGFYYDRIASYAADLAMQRFAGGTRFDQRLDQSPGVFIQSTLGQVGLADQRAAMQREAEVPASFTNQFDDVDALPTALRWARFLEEDGTTRTELYWSLHPRELHPSRRVRRRLRKQGHEPTNDYLLTVSVAQQTADYRTRVHYMNRHLVHSASDSVTTRAMLTPQTLVIRGDTGRYALAVQWDAYWTRLEGAEGTRHLGPKLKMETLRIDSLHALSRDPGRLEMSDLKPLLVENPTTPAEAAPPYPGTAILRETPLALYFEIYHLALAAGGQAHYVIAYEISYDQRGDEIRTAATTRYSGSQQTAREVIHLDLGLERTGPFRIRVRVTDETTGQTVERALAFEVYQEPTAW